PSLNTHTSRPPPRPTPFPYTTLFRSEQADEGGCAAGSECFEVLAEGSSSVAAAWTNGETDAAGLGELAGEPVHAQHAFSADRGRSEEHTSELQSPYDLVCRLLLEKKN